MLIEKWETLVLPTDLVAFHYRDQWLVTNPALAAWLLVAPWEYEVLNALVQRQPCAQLIATLAQQHAEPLEAARLRIEKALARYVLAWICYLPEKQPVIEVARPQLQQVYYAITEGCNLRCPYCYASAEKAHPGELSTAEACDLVDQAAAMGCREFIFTGGEPTLRRDLFTIVAYVREQGMRANIITNGTLIKTPEIAARMAQLFHRVTVSIDGGTAEVHELTRGKGTFKSVVRALHLLNDAGVSPNINHVVTPDNVDHLEHLTQLLDGLRVGQVKLMHHGPLGRGLEDNQDIDWVNYQKLHRFAWNSPTAQRVAAITPKKVRPCNIKGNCGLGGHEIYINSLGDVYPCKLITAESYKAGNIRERPLREIYAEPVLGNLRSLSVQNFSWCSRCYIRGACGGGCRAYHLGYSGSLTENAANFCQILRHQMVTSMWVNCGADKEVFLDEQQSAFIPLYIKKGDTYEVALSS